MTVSTLRSVLNEMVYHARVTPIVNIACVKRFQRSPAVLTLWWLNMVLLDVTIHGPKWLLATVPLRVQLFVSLSVLCSCVKLLFPLLHIPTIEAWRHSTIASIGISFRFPPLIILIFSIFFTIFQPKRRPAPRHDIRVQPRSQVRDPADIVRTERAIYERQ